MIGGGEERGPEEAHHQGDRAEGSTEGEALSVGAPRELAHRSGPRCRAARPTLVLHRAQQLRSPQVPRARPDLGHAGATGTRASIPGEDQYVEASDADGKRVRSSNLKSPGWEIGVNPLSRGTVQSDRWCRKMSALVGDKLIAIVAVFGWCDQLKALRAAHTGDELLPGRLRVRSGRLCRDQAEGRTRRGFDHPGVSAATLGSPGRAGSCTTIGSIGFPSGWSDSNTR